MDNFGCNNCEEWRKDGILGRGAFGIVELWKNEENGKTIAIKKCNLEMQSMTERQLERWQDEVRIMNDIQHPNIVGTRDVPGQVRRENVNFPVLCMEYCEGGDLRKVLNQRDNLCGLNEKDAVAIMKNITSAVEYLHKLRITHRDLKPENIVLQEERCGITYKLIDLGYAKKLDHSSISASIVGTLNYLAPELLWKDKYSSSVDYWSLGILFYEILTGIRPFLPTMSLNRTWMEHVLKKGYNDISIREIDGKVKASVIIEDPSNVSQCLKDDLVPWFRTVFQTDPNRRGKEIINGQPKIIVFTMFKSIFTQKIIHLFYVCAFKKEAYKVDDFMRVAELKAMILQKENIRIEDQILVSSEGKALEGSEQSIFGVLEESSVMVFEKKKLLIDKVPQPHIPADVSRMASSLLRKYDWQIIRRFYGASIFFMKQELELFKTYVMAISIKADLCNENFSCLASKIENILSESVSLKEKIQEFSPIFENQALSLEKSENFEILRRKINEFVDRAKGIEKELQIFEITKEKWNERFLSKNFTAKFEDICNNAVRELDCHFVSDQRHSVSAKKMIQLYFAFLKTRNEELMSKDLKEIGENFLRIENDLSKLEESLKSFESLLEKYQRDFREIEGSSGLRIDFVEPQGFFGDDGSIIRDNIVLGHLISGLLTEMEETKLKLGSLE